MIQGMINARQLSLYIDKQDVKNEDVITDKLRLNQVLINIVGNAIKFTPTGGDIIIRLEEKSCQKKGYTTYEFTIKDNGIGMSSEFLGHVFDTFAREQSSTVSGIQGTGLGMAITKNIADTLRVILEIANSVFPKCSIATKNRNQGATLIKAWSILHTDRFKTLISNRPS